MGGEREISLSVLFGVRDVIGNHLSWTLWPNPGELFNAPRSQNEATAGAPNDPGHGGSGAYLINFIG